MDIHLDKLKYSFKQKPLLVGGKAMEYYGLRKSGNDIDFIVTEADLIELIKLYPNRVKDLWGDLGVCPFEFEIWRTICLYDYESLKEHAIEQDDFLIISLEKLLLMKALGMKKEKYLRDLELIVKHIFDLQGDIYSKQIEKNTHVLRTIPGIIYIEKTGPDIKK